MKPRRDADATRLRILDAATVEFASHGLAGARIDRIAAAADSNKSMIYTYYGNKDGLFDAVLEAAFLRVEEAVTFDADDLVTYAVELFDYLREHPDHLRLDAWRRLERPEPTEVEIERYTDKVGALSERHENFGKGGRFTAADVIALVTALAGLWESTPLPVARLATQDLDLRRSLVAGSLEVLLRVRANPTYHPHKRDQEEEA
ncbi:MAG: TetR family transcriptional regulator [Actinomycetota bacterium]